MAGTTSTNAVTTRQRRRMQGTPQEDFGFAILQTRTPQERERLVSPNGLRPFKFGDSFRRKTERNRGIAAQALLLFNFFGKTRVNVVCAGHQLARGDLLRRSPVVAE